MNTIVKCRVHEHIISPALNVCFSTSTLLNYQNVGTYSHTLSVFGWMIWEYGVGYKDPLSIRPSDTAQASQHFDPRISYWSQSQVAQDGGQLSKAQRRFCPFQRGGRCKKKHRIPKNVNHSCRLMINLRTYIYICIIYGFYWVLLMVLKSIGYARLGVLDFLPDFWTIKSMLRQEFLCSFWWGGFHTNKSWHRPTSR